MVVASCMFNIQKFTMHYINQNVKISFPIYSTNRLREKQTSESCVFVYHRFCSLFVWLNEVNALSVASKKLSRFFSWKPSERQTIWFWRLRSTGPKLSPIAICQCKTNYVIVRRTTSFLTGKMFREIERISKDTTKTLLMQCRHHRRKGISFTKIFLFKRYVKWFFT